MNSMGKPSVSIRPAQTCAASLSSNRIDHHLRITCNKWWLEQHTTRQILSRTTAATVVKMIVKMTMTMMTTTMMKICKQIRLNESLHSCCRRMFQLLIAVSRWRPSSQGRRTRTSYLRTSRISSIWPTCRRLTCLLIIRSQSMRRFKSTLKMARGFFF